MCAVRIKSHDLRLSVHIKAEPADVYRALTQARALSSWWGKNAKIQARNGGHLSLEWPAPRPGRREGHCVDLDIGHKVAWLWSRKSAEKAIPPLNTFFIEPQDDGVCKVSVVHAGFDAGAAGQRLYKAYACLWQERLDQLKLYLETKVLRR